MKQFLVILIYLISFFSISFEIIKDSHFTLSLKSQELLNKKKFTFMKIRVVGLIITVIMNFFAMDQFKVLQIVTKVY